MIILSANNNGSVESADVHSGMCIVILLQLFIILTLITYDLSHGIRKPTICIGENKGADQLLSNCEADQHLCFLETNSTVPFLLRSKISKF